MAIGYYYPLIDFVTDYCYWLLTIVDGYGYRLLLWLLDIGFGYWLFWASMFRIRVRVFKS